MLLKEDFILCLAKLIWIVHIISFLHFLILFVKRKWTLLGLLMTLPDALSKILIIWIIFVLWNLTFFCHEIPNRSRWIIYNLGEFYYQWSVGFYPKQKIWTRVWMSVFVHIKYKKKDFWRIVKGAWFVWIISSPRSVLMCRFEVRCVIWHADLIADIFRD